MIGINLILITFAQFYCVFRTALLQPFNDRTSFEDNKPFTGTATSSFEIGTIEVKQRLVGRYSLNLSRVTVKQKSPVYGK